jgi:hypothetical protein
MAWTDRYVRADAAGGGNGTTNTNSGANGAWTLAEGVTNEAAGMRLNVLAGTYANTTTGRAFAAVGTTTAPIWWRGFKTTIGDQDTNNVAVAGTDIPSWTFTTGQITTAGAFHIFSNIDISSACVTANGAWSITGAPFLMYRCRIANTSATSTAQAANFAGTGELAVGCTFTATTTATRVVNANSLNGGLIGCVVSGGIIGVSATAQATTLFGDIFTGQAGDAINTSIALRAILCSIYAPTGNGINLTALVNNTLLMNNYFENVNQASKAAINNTSGTNTALVTMIANAYFNCTANRSGFTEDFTIFDNGTLGSAAFNAPGSSDFSIGTVARALGFPGLFENTNVFQGYLDVGAVQRQEPASGGLIYPRTFLGGFNG